MAFFEPVPEEQLSPESKRLGVAAFWNLATTFGAAMDAGLREE